MAKDASNKSKQNYRNYCKKNSYRKVLDRIKFYRKVDTKNYA